MGAVEPDPVPSLLNALTTRRWSPVGLSESGRELIDIRPDLVESMHRLLPSTDDPLYDDFRRCFFPHAFHPREADDKTWVAELSGHSWYLKLQQGRFPHPSNREAVIARQQAVEEAREKFFDRLLKNPTLGLSP